MINNILIDGEGVSRYPEKCYDFNCPRNAQILLVIVEIIGGFTVESKLKLGVLVKLPGGKKLLINACLPV